MIREIFAYILLAAILIGSLFNVRYMEKTFGKLEDEAERAFSCAESGDTETATEIMSKVCEKWLALDSYTHVFLKHTEIDSTTDAFFELLSDISEENTDSAEGSLRKLEAHLDSLTSAERLYFGSIF